MTHILIQVARIADTQGRLPVRLIREYDDQLVRLECKEHNLWIMVGAEDGSILDRWSHDSGRVLVKLTAKQVAAGAASVHDNLVTLAGVS